MINYFEILGINVTDDEVEIKKGYGRSIRIYTPEKDPERFNEIRKAYEVLGNSEMRKKHINELRIGSTVEDLEEKFYEALNNEDYNLAETIYKNMYFIDKNLYIVMYAKGRLLEENQRYKEALDHYGEMLRNFDDNDGQITDRRIASLIHLGDTDIAKMAIVSQLKKKRRVSVAFSAFILKNCRNKNFEENFSIICSMEALLVDSENYDNIAFIKWYKIHTLLVSSDKRFNLKSEIYDLCRIIPKANVHFNFLIEEMSNVANLLGKGYRVYEKMLILKAMEETLMNEPDRKAIDFYNLSMQVCEEIEVAYEDDKIEKSVVNLAYRDVYEECLNLEGKYEEYNKTITDNLDYLLTNKPKTLINAIDYIKYKYKGIYTYETNIFEELRKIAKENVEILNNNKNTNYSTNTNSTSSASSSTSTSSNDSSGTGGFFSIIFMIAGGVFLISIIISILSALAVPLMIAGVIFVLYKIFK